jgi:hypothetical protein
VGLSFTNQGATMLKGYEAWACVGYQAPVDANDADVTLPTTTTGIDMALWSEILVILQIGVTAGTLTIKLQDSATTNGTYADISGKTKTTAATDDGLIFIISLRSSSMNAGARFVRVIQNNNAASQIQAVLVLGKATNPPATDNKITAQQTVVD